LSIIEKVADLKGLKNKGGVYKISTGEIIFISDEEAYSKRYANEPRMFVGDWGYFERTFTYYQLLMGVGLKEDSKVLDIGCGMLNMGRLLIPILSPACFYGIEPNKHLIRVGFETQLGFDIIPTKRPKFSTNHDFNLDVFGVEFDYIISHSVFSHAAPAQIQKCLSQIKKVLKVGGVGFISYVNSTKDIFSSEWVYPGINQYKFATMRKWVEAEGLNMGFIKKGDNALQTPDNQVVFTVQQKT